MNKRRTIVFVVLGGLVASGKTIKRTREKPKEKRDKQGTAEKGG